MADLKLIEAIEQFEIKFKKGKKHFIYDAGICENLSAIGKKFYHFEIKQIVQNWKHFSGDLTYPIGGMEEYNFHKENETLWVGDQLKLRLTLINYLKLKLKGSINVN